MKSNKYRTSDSYSKTPRTQYNQNEMNKGLKIPAGIYRGIVVDVEDPSREGRIKVQIMKFYGTHPVGESTDPNSLDPEKYLGAMWCRTMLPMGGTSAEPGAETSYGFVGQPPDINNEVIVAFGGDTHNGIVLGVLLDPGRNEGAASAGARGATAQGTVAPRYEQPSSGQPGDLPNEHPQAEALRRQGLENDLIRGPSSSSPRRDPSPRVTGVTTPAGHSLTLDDGDGEDEDDVGIRLRSAGGAQILMDDTNGLTYINNRDGSVWIELNRNGDIDIFAAGSINMHTPGSFNLHTGADFNLHAIGNINMRGTNIGMESLGGFDALSVGNMNLTSESNGNLNMSGNLRVTAGRIDLNGPTADTAEVVSPGSLAGNTGVTESISPRVPESEPWAGHLDVAQQLPGGAAASQGNLSLSDVVNVGGGSAGGGGRRPSGGGGGGRRPSGGGGGGGGRVQDSDSYYYGQPSDIRTYDEQTGEWAERQALAAGGDYLNILPGVDMRVEQRLVDITNEAARQVGIPLTIVDGFRETAGRGASNSQHLYGRAFDISRQGINNQERLDLCEAASTLGITGIGIYSSGSLHWDIRPGQRVVWGDDWTSGSVPAYAREFAAAHRSGSFFDPGALQESLGGEDFSGGTTEGLDGDNYVDPAAGDFSPTEISDPRLQSEVSRLESDPAWNRELAELEARYPGLDRNELYRVIDGESRFDPTARNPSGASGLFQFMPATARELGYDTATIRRMSPAQQLNVYGKYLDRWNYNPSNSLGIMQAAPAYANSRSGNDVVYGVGSAAWRQNPGWRSSPNGPITVEGINRYYRNR